MIDKLKLEPILQSSKTKLKRGDGQTVAALWFLRPFYLPLLAALLLLMIVAGCRSDSEAKRVRPRQLRDVPTRRLAYRFEADVEPPKGSNEETVSKLAPIQDDFNTRRKDDALLRTVASPDGQRALALYGTGDEPNETFHIDLYASDGKFLRNLTPPDLAASFPEAAVWSSDGNVIAFIGRKSLRPQPSPTPPEEAPLVPGVSPEPSATIAPAFAPVPLFNTEQIYVCNRDGFDLRPLTTREGLIYFYVAWAPDNHALVALACREAEWDARDREHKLPAGRPRLVSLDGGERLLDDALAEAPPVWSPDSSKVATAFETDVGIYDAAGKSPTQARIPLRDLLIKASADYEAKNTAAKKKSENGKAEVPSPPSAGRLPVSFNPIVRVEWPSADKLYVQTAYLRLSPYDSPNPFYRWHLVVLSPQAALLGK